MAALLSALCAALACCALAAEIAMAASPAASTGERFLPPAYKPSVRPSPGDSSIVIVSDDDSGSEHAVGQQRPPQSPAPATPAAIQSPTAGRRWIGPPQPAASPPNSASMFSDLPDVARPEPTSSYPQTNQAALPGRPHAKLPTPTGSAEVQRAIAADLTLAQQLFDQQTADAAANAAMQENSAATQHQSSENGEAEGGWFQKFSDTWPLGQTKSIQPPAGNTVFGLDLTAGDANAKPEQTPPAEEPQPKRLPKIFTPDENVTGLWTQFSAKDATPAAGVQSQPVPGAAPAAAAPATSTVAAEAVNSRITGLVHQFTAANNEPAYGTASGAAQNARSAAPAQPTQATAGSAGQQNPWAELWRPMTITDTRQSQAELALAPKSPNPASASAKNSPAEAEQVPTLLQPFFLTNTRGPQPHEIASSGTGAAGSTLFPSLSDADQGGAQAVAFLQEADEETLPVPTRAADDQLQPEDLGIPGAEPKPPAAAGTPGAAGADGEESKTLVGADKLGEEPTDNSLQFLRFTGILLEPGETQFDVGLTYTFSENQFPFSFVDGGGSVVAVDEANFRLRDLEVPFEVRCGLFKRVQLFVGSSVGWSNAEFSVGDIEQFDNDGGIGDVYAGTTMQFREQNECGPHVIGTLGFTAPTGNDPFSAADGFLPSGPSLGGGFWSIFGSVLCIRTYDPVTIFYGVGTNQSFPHEYVGVDIQPGGEYNYTFGAGFAVNERMTLSTQFNGAWVDDLKVDGQRVEGSTQEPMSIRFAATISKKNRIVEPFIRFGITEDATTSYFGCIWTF